MVGFIRFFLYKNLFPANFDGAEVAKKARGGKDNPDISKQKTKVGKTCTCHQGLGGGANFPRGVLGLAIFVSNFPYNLWRISFLPNVRHDFVNFPS